MLLNGQRCGFFLGDGAGVGKGRQIAAIILDNYVRGRRQHVWFSTSTDLRLDAERDLKDLGCSIQVINGTVELESLGKAAFGLSQDARQGVLFSTYAMLGRANRRKQIVDWCGPEFEGCLVFDECHKAKNFVPDSSSSTKVAAAAVEIQRLLPKARVVYCSATGVSEIQHMAYMERLGLWGPQTGFTDFLDFQAAFAKKGLGVLEMIAVEMKTEGKYITRTLSFDEAEFEIRQVDLPEDEIRMFNQASEFWTSLKAKLDTARSLTGSQQGKLTYWTNHQRFFKQLCLSMKLNQVIEDVEKGLEEGYSVVIGLQSTGEYALRKYETTRWLPDFVSATRESLMEILNQFPTENIENGLSNPQCVALKDELLREAQGLTLPPTPLDYLIDRLGGPDKVAEMTGRRHRVVRMNGRYMLQSRAQALSAEMDMLNITEKRSFMNGEKLVAIISDAASTGISLHADRKVKNQRRRLHLTIELAWSAEKAIQQMGRTHRSSQSSAPLYRLYSTTLGGESRFISCIAKRLKHMGALTKGDRNATGQDLSEYDVDDEYGQLAARRLAHRDWRSLPFPINMQKIVDAWNTNLLPANEERINHQDPGIVFTTAEMLAVQLNLDDVNVKKLLNRVLGLQVHEQNLMFQLFTELYAVEVKFAKKVGKYVEGIADVIASSAVATGERESLWTVPRSAFKHVISVDRGISWEAVVNAQKDSDDETSQFYISKRAVYSQRQILFAMPKDADSFVVIRPRTGYHRELKADIEEKYDPIAAEEAEELWKSQYEQGLSQCMHGQACKNKATCRTGLRISQVIIISGCLIPYWATMEEILTSHSAILSRDERSLQVVRVQFDDGKRLLGVRFPLRLVPLLVEQVQGFISRNSATIVAKEGATYEEPSKIDARSHKRAFTKAPSILNFFQKRPAMDTNPTVDNVAKKGKVEKKRVPKENGLKALVAKMQSKKEVAIIDLS